MANPLQARGELHWRYGHERALLMTEFWAPVMQDELSVLYGDLRLMGDDHDNREGNLGFGYRRIVRGPASLERGVAGGHAWIDQRITDRGSTFHQATLGAEWLGETMDLRANAYLALSDAKEYGSGTGASVPSAPFLAGTGLFVNMGGGETSVLEEPQDGFDIELGWQIPFLEDHMDSFHLYGGGYYFDGPNTESMSGWRTRIAADITPDFQIGARFQRDDERGSQGFIEATIRFPFGAKKSYRKDSLRARLDESPERDVDIVTGSKTISSGEPSRIVPVLNTATGTEQKVLHVDNTAAGGGDGSAETPFNTLATAEAAAGAHSIIYVHTGDGADTNQDQGIILNATGQQLIGAGTNFVYDSGLFTSSAGTPSSTLILAASGAPVISNVNVNGDGVRITADDVRVAGITVDGAARDGIVVEADGGAASAQNVTITDVTTRNNRHGVYIHGANGGSVSTMLQSSVITLNSQHGVAVYDDTAGTFGADLGGGAMGSAGHNVLAGNTLEDLAVDMDGATLMAQNNWWGQASGPDIDTPNIGTAPQIYYGAPLNTGLVGHWTFDTEWTSNTTAYDRSGLSNDGTLQNGLSLADQVAGQNGEALNFDGDDDLVDIGLIGIGNPLMLSGTNGTIVAWVNQTAGGDPWQRIVDKSDNITATNGYALLMDQANGYDPAVDGVDAITGVVTTGVWNNVVAIYNDGANDSFYLNNALVSGALNLPDIPNVATNMRIGSWNHSTTREFGGRLDDIRIYNRALSSGEIAEIYRMDTSSTVDTSGFLTAAP